MAQTTLKMKTEEIDQSIGKRVRDVRKAIGMSQSDLAAELGITFQQVQKYENGKNRISVSALILICSALKCSVNDIVSTFAGDDEGNVSSIALKLADAQQRLKSIASLAA